MSDTLALAEELWEVIREPRDPVWAELGNTDYRRLQAWTVARFVEDNFVRIEDADAMVSSLDASYDSLSLSGS